MDGTQQPTSAAASETQGSSASRGARSAGWSGVLAEQGYVIGIDISGAGERVAISNLEGEVVGRADYQHNDTVSHEPRRVVERVTNMVTDLLEGEGIKNRSVLRAGIGFGGPVDAAKGLVRRSFFSHGWDGFPLAAEVERVLDVPTLLDNDARLAALGEVWFGAGKKIAPCDLVYLHWSTGVGGGIVSEGKLVRGADSVAGEIGHMTVRSGPDALPCRCGGRGHLEAYVRPAALASRARAVRPDFPDPGEQATLESLVAGAESDEQLRALVDDTVDLVAITIGSVITLADPRIVVIGGRAAREAPALVDRIARQALDYAMPLAAEGVSIVPAALGDNSGVMGAVALGFESLR